MKNDYTEFVNWRYDHNKRYDETASVAHGPPYFTPAGSAGVATTAESHSFQNAHVP